MDCRALASNCEHPASGPRDGGDNVNKLQRIYVYAINLDTPMQMRAADPPGCTGQPQRLSLFDVLAGFDIDSTQVRII